MIPRLLVLAVLVAGCTADQAPVPGAGTLTLALTSAGNADGAIILLVSGGPVRSVAAPTGYRSPPMSTVKAPT